MTDPSSSSGSPEFDLLRNALASDSQLHYEVEALFRLVVETYNPSDRGVRFITGGISEWVLAMAAYAAGVVLLPAGHNANSFDLQDVIDQSRALWSAKGSNTRGGTFTITNGQNGPGSGLTTATIFWSPELPGLVYVDPRLHPDVAAAQQPRPDATVIAKAVIAAHAAARPACVAPLTIPVNPKTADLDPAFEAVKRLVDGGSFPRLRRLLDDARRADSSVVGQLHELRAMRDSGDLSPEAYEQAVRKVTAT